MITGRGFASLSLMDALDLAVLMEEEARERYLELSRTVGGRYAGDASDMFRMMASWEERHGAEIESRRRQLFGDAARRVTRDAVFEAEAPSLNAGKPFLSARQAMEVSLASEQKAYDFFSGALPHIVEPDVRVLFEELRQEELKHQRFVQERIDKLPPGPDLTEEEADEPGSDPGN